MHRGDSAQVLIILLVIVFVVLFKGGIGYLIGRNKGKGGLGFVLGLFLGIIGWIIIAVIPGEPAPVNRVSRLRRPERPGPGRPGADDRVPCPHCAEMIRPAAHVCRFCNNKIL